LAIIVPAVPAPKITKFFISFIFYMYASKNVAFLL
jgi:hypothetical protein